MNESWNASRYTSWSPQTDTMLETWDRLNSIVQERALGVRLAKVDGDSDPGLIALFHLKYYPAILL